ncbi:hypothetical protein [uncultured Kriegella sp.]|uniref:hypothetical protein n=1 Tax=uncultured Kriegella sp. TaxID=1798910 RepID=UPI0030D9A4C6|tara:strand:+ start:32991 stop:34187 length:1197 start_codon:yes stop_codon:yes gene_type:complete
MRPTLLLAITITFFSVSCSKEAIVENHSIEPMATPVNDQPEEIERASPLMQNESYHWLAKMQLPNGLLASTEHSDFVSLYDNALAALLFIENGETEKAERIFDFFQNKVDSELRNGTGGFYQFRDKNGKNGSRPWMGDNAWLLIALNNYHQTTGNKKYQGLARNLEDWIRTLQDDDGGLWGGQNEDGSPIPKVTEGIITAFNAVKGFDNFHSNILSYLFKNRWHETKSIFTSWPENPTYLHALDLHALAQMIFEDFPKINLERTEALFFTTQWSTLTGQSVSGYCFDEDKDVVWLEGTGQMAAAYSEIGNNEKANALIRELEKTFINSSITEDAKGIPYTTNYGSTYGANLLWDHADTAPAVSSTVWYLFAKMGFNPLKFGKQKNIPENDKFWTSQSN